ncbi:PucR family transcriptional regulator [Haloechinothrix halophila]|uniref:PucR family transcriptional regulator n=1 Tax=Haloechinothrix halophila TaxID=1069073 RepID=UPI00040B63C9|nr:PucR family transcriptional regulator [Haloechinothrix halophila]
MRVRDLVEMSDLHLVPLTGEAGMDRPIRWVYTTDLLDPSRYLSGGELVLTGMMWRRGTADSADFVSVTAARHVACIAAGDAAYGTVPPDLVTACVAREIPLLEVPVDVSFATITDRVIHLLTIERQGDLAEQLDRRRKLLAAVAEGAGLDTVLRLWSEGTDVRCFLRTATGRSPVVSEGGDEVGALLAERFLVATSLPRVVTIGGSGDAGTYSLFPVDVRSEHRATAWFLACEGDFREWPRVRHESVTELASLLALERERIEEGRRADRVVAEQLFRLVLSGRSTREEIAGRLAEFGLGDHPYVAVSASLLPVADGQLACRILDEVLATVVRDGRTLVSAVDNEAVALLPLRSETVTDMLRAQASALAPAMADGRLLLGLSLPTSGPDGLSAALSEARQARTLAELRGGTVAVLATDEIDSHALLLATVPDDVRRTFLTRVLGPVLAYDERHGSDLIGTLEAFLAASGSWTACAERLHVHVNTLRYRIRRIEELTGRSLATLEHRVDFFLALRAR